MKVTYVFQNCQAWVDWEGEYVETQFSDATRVPACPQRTEAYFATCRDTGYGSDVAMLSREHELLHSWLMERLGYRESPTLWAVAHDLAPGTAPLTLQYHEEALVLAFQGYLNGMPGLLPVYPVLHGQATDNSCWVNWRAWRERAWALFRTLPDQETEDAVVDCRSVDGGPPRAPRRQHGGHAGRGRESGRRGRGPE